jgi:outer membrane beta-barrel protein
MKNIFLILILTFAANIKAAEKDLYDFLWLDSDKKVYVLQNKIHKKENSFYFNLSYGIGLSSTYVDTSVFHFNTGYYFTEELAIEAMYTKYSNSENENLSNIKRISGLVPFIRNPLSNYGGLVKWSPFYGKINTFNKIFYFDWSFGAGLGVLNSESNKDTVSNPSISNRYSKENYLSGILKTELTLHASKNLHFSLGLIINNFSAPGPTINKVVPTSKLRNEADTLFSVGYSF